MKCLRMHHASSELTGTSRPRFFHWLALVLVILLPGVMGVDCSPDIEPVTILRWQNVQAPSGVFSDVWGAAPDDIWAVGPRDKMIHWDGSAWSSVTVSTGAQNTLWTIWGAASNDIWASGDIPNAVLHWDGSSWSSVPFPDLPGSPEWMLAIWGFSSSDVWAVGEGGTTAIHWDGTSWSAVNIGNAFDTVSWFGLWGTAPNDLWAVGSGANIIHWDGTSWSAVPNGTSSTSFLRDIWGTSANDVWAVGSSGLILRWDASNWSDISASSGMFEAVSGASVNDLWIGPGAGLDIHHWDGSALSSVSATISVEGLWGFGAEDVWAVGGGVAHYSRVVVGNP